MPALFSCLDHRYNHKNLNDLGLIAVYSLHC
jgi:hypothetical protein